MTIQVTIGNQSSPEQGWYRVSGVRTSHQIKPGRGNYAMRGLVLDLFNSVKHETLNKESTVDDERSAVVCVVRSVSPAGIIRAIPSTRCAN